MTVEQLKEWNNLKSSSLMPKQELLVMQQAEAGAVLALNTKGKPEAKSAVEKKELIYHVQPGDTLWNISKKYNGISVEQIKKLNRLRSNEIKPGQKLILS